MDKKQEIKETDSQKWPGYFTYELFVSPAYRHLKPAAKDILIQFFFEYQLKKKSKTYENATGRRLKHHVINRDKIILPYDHIKTRLGYSDNTIWKSIKQIMAHGFLRVVDYGGGAKGDYQVYGAVEDWFDWKPGQVIRELRPNGKIGFQKKISLTRGEPPKHLPLNQRRTTIQNCNE